MENKKQDQQQRASTDGAAKRISATYSEPTPPSEHFDLDLDHNTDPKDEPQKPGWRKFLAHVGPGFLVSLAYLDPGNLETDLQAGANHRYELLWVILIGLIFALIIQSLSANLGVTTGKHLSELCKAEYPPFVKYCLWLLAEVAVIAADIPEVIGTAFALNILFNIPVWAGVLLTGFSTLLLLGLQKYGVRKLEMLIAVLVFVMAACFFGEMSYVKPPASGVLKGMFIPKLSGQGATGDAIALLGALVMPHNLFLHSALVLSRKIPKSVRGINDACRYFLIESGFALFVAFLINVAIVSVSGTVCHQSNLSDKDNDTCSDLTLNSASFLLQALGLALVHEPAARACWGALASQRWSRSLGHLGPMLSTIPRAIAPGGAALMNVLGRSSKILYAIALLASGQSSTITGTYAGQFVMQGFLNIKMKKWARNLMTRCIAITPSLIVSIIGGSSGAGRLIIIASMILSFELPFALIPLLKFSGSTTKMGPHKNSIYIIVISWILGMGIIGINIYYLSTGFVGWIIHSSLPKVATVFIGILVFPFMAIYILAVLYLTLRKDSVVTFVEPTMNDPAAQNQMENGLPNYGEPPAPFREDLADIPLPQ